MWPAGTLQNLTCERKAGLGAQRHGGRLLLTSDVEMVNPIKGSWSDVCPPLLWSGGNTYGCIAKGWVFLMEKNGFI